MPSDRRLGPIWGYLRMMGESESLKTQRALDLLSDRRRRIVVRRLQRADRTLTIDELVAAIADAEGVSDEREGTAIKSDLHHVHLPKLIEAGIADYDSRSGSVPYHGDECVEKLLAFIEEELP